MFDVRSVVYIRHVEIKIGNIFALIVPARNISITTIASLIHGIFILFVMVIRTSNTILMFLTT